MQIIISPAELIAAERHFQAIREVAEGGPVHPKLAKRMRDVFDAINKVGGDIYRVGHAGSSRFVFNSHHSLRHFTAHLSAPWYGYSSTYLAVCSFYHTLCCVYIRGCLPSAPSPEGKEAAGAAVFYYNDLRD